MLGRGGYETVNSSWEGARQRSFFGVYIVRESEMAGLRGLTHGTTLHGLQFADPKRAREPTSYYTRSAGVGMALSQADKIVGPAARVGIVGLGIGTLACYRQPDQHYAFFEIDPVVASYSRPASGAPSFTFLERWAPRAPIHFGDARLVLAKAKRASFDVLVIDAFSSDSIPVHLMTREAFAIYRRALAPGGLLLVHISNRYIDLKPVVAALAAESGLHAQIRQDLDKPAAGASASVWVALSADQDTHVALVAASPFGAWEALPPAASGAWSDDYASILPHILWNKLL
jgi:SAM-dependent methyltransferase